MMLAIGGSVKEKYWSQPKKARPLSNTKAAWWYANPNSIEILVDIMPGYNVGSAVIKRSDLLRYIAQTAKEE